MPSAASDLTAASWEAFSRLLDEALERPAGERLAWLEALGAEHEALKPALRAVLVRSAGVETAQWMNTLPHTASAAALVDDSDLQAGGLVGPYRLLRELGVGGMGAVWLAERADGTLKRQVALKLPRASWSRGLAERMARERDILAALEHPHIARLYDAGTEAQGRPFLALEYVEGQPIDVYCHERSLALRGRVDLLLQVAHAVAFAHSRLVVHRDLKPSNILVTADGQVRLLDFGIAKLMEGDRAQETQLTQLAGRALTLDYASPEQIRGEPIGTASDVYSLGVVAYELLAGAKPYRLKRHSAAELEEAIAAVDAPLASATATDAQTRKELKGDLDAILNKALKKNASERYASVTALADDIQRWLDHQPVLAQSDTAGYRLRKFIHRNKLQVGAAVIVSIAIVAGAVGALYQASVAREQARIAQTEAKTAEAVQNFLEGIFRANSGDQPDPIRARQRTAIELLNEGAKRIETEMDDAPAAKLRVLAVLAEVYADLDQNDTGLAMHRRRVTVAERAFGAADPRLADALANVGMFLMRLGRMAEAREMLVRADAVLAASTVQDDEARLSVDVAWGEWGRFANDAQALPNAERALTLALKRPPSNAWINALAVLGIMQRLAGRLDDSAATFERAMALAPQVPGGALSVLAAVQDEAAETAMYRGDAAAAERYLRGSVALDERAYGPKDGRSSTGLSTLANFLASEGRFADAFPVFVEARTLLDLLPQNPDNLRTHCLVRRNEALARYDHGQLAAAWALLEEIRALTRDLSANPNCAALNAHTLSDVLIDLGRDAEAEAAIDEARRIVRERQITGARWAAQELRVTARLELSRGNPETAARRLDSAREIVIESPHLQRLRAEAALRSGAHDEAAVIAERALGAIETPPRPLQWANLRTRLLLTLGRARLGQRRVEEAVAVLEQALQAALTTLDSSLSLDAAEIRIALGQARLAAGDALAAKSHLDAAIAIHKRYANVGRHYAEPLAALIRGLGGAGQ
jgi:serine/threonine-protein kinase